MAGLNCEHKNVEWVSYNQNHKTVFRSLCHDCKEYLKSRYEIDRTKYKFYGIGAKRNKKERIKESLFMVKFLKNDT